MKSLYGLIGYPLGHSFSADYFTAKFETQKIEAEYINFPLENISQLPDMLKNNPNLRGFNVTIPYKQEIISFLDELSPQAQEIGAVNCVKIENKTMKGYNTDAYGFEKSLLSFLDNTHIKALILGTGGASKAVEFVLNKLKIEYRVVSRNKSCNYLTYADVNDVLPDHKLIINTTPLGTFPNINNAPDIPYNQLDPTYFLFDLVYNPPETKFLQLGKQQGAKVINGLDMLIGQAEKAWDIWNRI